MLHELEKEINLNKEVIDSLPNNNEKTKESYLKEVNESINKYATLKDKIYKELEERKEPYLNIPETDYTEYVNSLAELSKALSFTNNLNTAYEKLKIDKLVYSLSRGEANLIEINKTLLKLITIFSHANIKLTPNDFNYTNYVKSYMNNFFKNIDNLESDELKKEFDALYWKNPNIVLEIELNIRYLYLKNKDKFSKYINDLNKKIISKLNKGEEDIINDYTYLRIKLENLKASDRNFLLNKFTSDKLKIDDYLDEKVDKVISNLTDSKQIEGIVKMLNSLEEYQGYLKYEEIISKIKTLYNEDLEKNFLENKIKSIMKLESKRIKMNKKTTSILNTKTKVNKYELEVDDLIKQIKEIYNEIDQNMFKVVCKKHMQNNSTLFKALLLSCQYYTFLADFFKEANPEISYKEIEQNIKELYYFVLNPNNNIINNITLLEDVDIANIIVDKYKIFNFNINKDMITIGNLDSLINDLNKVIINNRLKKLNISPLELQNFNKIKALEEK